MGRILGCGPAGLRQGRGPLGKCSSCYVLPANLKVKVGGDEMDTESHGGEEGGAGRVEGRQKLEERSILEESDQGQMYVSSVGFQARRSATGGSPPPVSGVRRSDRWTARRGAPPCDLGSCGNTAILQGVGEMEAGSEQCKEPDDENFC